MTKIRVESEQVHSSNEQRSSLFDHSSQDTVESFHVYVHELAGGRTSAQETAVFRTGQDLNEATESIARLREFAEDDEELLESGSLYKWLTDIAREDLGNNNANEAANDEAEARQSNLATDSESLTQIQRLDDWLEDIFVLDLAAKIQGYVLVGGADEQDDISSSALSPYCNKPVGDETEQHALKCKFAHEEQEKLDWMMRRDGELRG